MLKLEFDDVNWIQLSQDREDLCDLVSKVFLLYIANYNLLS